MSRRAVNQWPPFVCTGYTFNSLPVDKGLIHPAMSPELDKNMAYFCDILGVSIWDREKVFHALTAIQPNPENV